LFVKPEGAGLYAQDADGNVALIGVSVDETDSDGNKKSVVKLTADNIQLEGLVTANGNFKILEDGSIETNNAKLKGYMYSVFKPIELSDAIVVSEEEVGASVKYEYKLNTNLNVDATMCGVVLPVSESYEGARVLIMDSHFVKTRVSTPSTTIRTEDGSQIISGLFLQSASTGEYTADKLIIDSGVVELILLNRCERNGSTGEVESYSLQWVLVNNSCQYLAWQSGDTTYTYKYNLY